MNQPAQQRASSEGERIPALIEASREFALWRRVKGVRVVSALAIAFWSLLLILVLD